MSSRRGKSGFTLIEVLAAFAIALMIIGPIASIISGVAGTFSGLERSAQRRVDLQAAGAAAMVAEPLTPGTRTVGDFTIRVTPYGSGDERDLQQAGWRLYTVAVSKAKGSSRGVILETVRIGRL